MNRLIFFYGSRILEKIRTERQDAKGRTRLQKGDKTSKERQDSKREDKTPKGEQDSDRGIRLQEGDKREFSKNQDHHSFFSLS